MKKSIGKMTIRSIRSSKGRFAALFLIVALSVGFFSGLKMTKPDMYRTLEVYLEETAMHDFRLISTVGFPEEAAKELEEIDGVMRAEGSKNLDAILDVEGNGQAYRLISIPEEVNQITVTQGRMPRKAGECLVDADRFSKEDLGKRIALADDNEDPVFEGLLEREFEIVGLVETPLYVGLDRGSTSIAGGSLKGFVYVRPEVFVQEYYNEEYVVLEETAAIYSEEYEELLEEFRPKIRDRVEELVQTYHGQLLAKQGLSPELAAQMGIGEPDTYVLTREENAGYVSFRNDTAIISGIANVFPLFFILVAMLVCVTTMGRMVSEERTQIGVLKAMGFSSGAVMAKYFLYVGSATVVGWAVGYGLGTLGIPQVFWIAYQQIYNFADLSYQFHPWILLGTLVVALAGTLGSTLYSCGKTLGLVPAKLIRPKTPKAGRRILLERITPLWNAMSFLQKVSTRNLFRYKQRLVMMIVGISGCTALLVTGFGVKDSLMPTGELQYQHVNKYDLKVDFPQWNDGVESFFRESEQVEDVLYCNSKRYELVSQDESRTVQFYALEEDGWEEFFTFEYEGESVDFPGKGEILVSSQAARRLGVDVGDSILVRDSDRKEISLRIAGLFLNYVDNYAIVGSDTYRDAFGSWEPDVAFVKTEEKESLAKELLEREDFSGVTVQSDRQAVVDDSLECLNYIILMIICFAGALAFVVIYNLTNINLAERSREVATVKVLGFYPRETSAYVLRENLVLSVAAGLVGLPLGVALHRFVLYMIDIEWITFPIRIQAVSYLWSFLLTVAFAILVNLYMRRRVDAINMAESLKTVE